MRQRAYRRRADGVLELVHRRRARLRPLLVSGAMAIGALAAAFAVSIAVAASVRPSNFQRTAGPATICWNWSAGPGSGCWTR